MSDLETREKFGEEMLAALKKGRIIGVNFGGDQEEFSSNMLMAPYGMFKHSPKSSKFVYGVASETVTGNIHNIVFDNAEDAGEAGVGLFRNGVV